MQGARDTPERTLVKEFSLQPMDKYCRIKPIKTYKQACSAKRNRKLNGRVRSNVVMGCLVAAWLRTFYSYNTMLRFRICHPNPFHRHRFYLIPNSITPSLVECIAEVVMF